VRQLPRPRPAERLQGGNTIILDAGTGIISLSANGQIVLLNREALARYCR